MGEIVAMLFEIKFNFFGDEIVIGNLYQTLKGMLSYGFVNTGDYSIIWDLGLQLFDILKPVSLSLLTLFFIMDMYTLLRDVQQVSWERVLMKGVKMFGVYMMITLLPQLLDGIITIIHGSFDTVVANVSINAATQQTSLPDAIRTAFRESNGIVTEVIAAVILVMMFVSYIGTAIAAVVAVFQRFFKLLLLYSIAPIPVCLLVCEPTQQVGKRFFQVFVAVLLETLIIYVLLEIYRLGLSNIAAIDVTAGLINGPLGFGIAVSMYNAVLVGGISICSSLAREAVGATAF